MNTSLSPKKILRGKHAPIPDDAKCAICGISKPLEKSHIIPKNKFNDFLSVDKTLFIDHDSLAIMYLCCNHHTLYETFSLETWEYLEIQHKVLATIAKVLEHGASELAKGVAVSPAFFNKIEAFSQSFGIYGKEK